MAVPKEEAETVRRRLLEMGFLRKEGKVAREGDTIFLPVTKSIAVGFPNVERDKIAVSIDGGIGPLWAHDGGELFYVSGDAMIAATIETEPEFRVVGRDTQFTIPPEILVSSGTPFYDVADDQRFLMGRVFRGGEGESDVGPRYILVQNFFEELRQRVGN